MAIDDLEGVMRRVQKLLAMAQDGRGDINEATSAAAMAEKIMRKYQLDHQDILVNSLKAGDNLCTSDHKAYTHTEGVSEDHKAKTIPVWCRWIGAQVAALMDVGCRMTEVPKYGMRIRFYGMKQDVMVAGWMFDYLLTQVRQLTKQFAKAHTAKATKDGAVASYRRGCALGITSVLEEKVQEKLAEQEAAKAASPTGTSLMVVKQNAITVKYGKFDYPKKKSTPHRNAEAYAAGQEDGRNVDINVRGVNAPTGTKPILIGN